MAEWPRGDAKWGEAQLGTAGALWLGWRAPLLGCESSAEWPGLVLFGDHLTDMGGHHLPQLFDLVRSLAVEVVRVRFIAVCHHCGEDRVIGLSLDYSAATLTSYLRLSLLVGILDT